MFSLTKGHSLDGIDIIVLGANRAVDIDGLGVFALECLYLIWFQFVVAEDAVEIDYSSIGLPRERNGILHGVGLKRGEFGVAVEPIDGQFTCIGLLDLYAKGIEKGESGIPWINPEAELMIDARTRQVYLQVATLTLFFCEFHLFGVFHLVADSLFYIQHQFGQGIPNDGLVVLFFRNGHHGQDGIA